MRLCPHLVPIVFGVLAQYPDVDILLRLEPAMSNRPLKTVPDELDFRIVQGGEAGQRGINRFAARTAGKRSQPTAAWFSSAKQVESPTGVKKYCILYKHREADHVAATHCRDAVAGAHQIARNHTSPYFNEGVLEGREIMFARGAWTEDQV